MLYMATFSNNVIRQHENKRDIPLIYIYNTIAGCNVKGSIKHWAKSVYSKTKRCTCTHTKEMRITLWSTRQILCQHSHLYSVYNTLTFTYISMLTFTFYSKYDLCESKAQTLKVNWSFMSQKNAGFWQKIFNLKQTCTLHYYIETDNADI